MFKDANMLKRSTSVNLNSSKLSKRSSLENQNIIEISQVALDLAFKKFCSDQQVENKIRHIKNKRSLQ